MTTETMLAPEEILHLWDTRVNEPSDKYPLMDGDKIQFARAIEQAVLQSPEVQRLREDVGRYQWPLKQYPCNIATLLDCAISDIDLTIDSAMEKKI